MSHLIFTDQRSFMAYRGQKPGPGTVTFFRGEVGAEYGALQAAWDALETAGTVDGATAIAEAAIGLITASAGLLHALGLDPQPLWDEVHRSNVAALRHPCGCDGGCERCVSGVVYESRPEPPEGWTPPNLKPLVAAMLK